MDPIADPERIQSRAAVTAQHEAPAVAANPRASLVAHLSAGMAAALASGDPEAARVAYEAIGKLLGQGGPVAHVGDLGAER